jgi:lysophospholipase L1-like esterase
LDDCKPEKIVVKIGTNNFGRDTNIDIVEGIRFLLGAIRVRQPEATIRVLGILPRRGEEQRVKEINLLIEAMAKQGGYEFADPGRNLLLENGKINETLFTDGLHPNDAGYECIVEDFMK